MTSAMTTASIKMAAIIDEDCTALVLQDVEHGKDEKVVPVSEHPTHFVPYAMLS